MLWRSSQFETYLILFVTVLYGYSVSGTGLSITGKVIKTKICSVPLRLFSHSKSVLYCWLPVSCGSLAFSLSYLSWVNNWIIMNKIINFKCYFSVSIKFHRWYLMCHPYRLKLQMYICFRCFSRPICKLLTVLAWCQ